MLENFVNANKSKDSVWLMLVFLSVLVVMLPIPFLGIPSGFDLPQHFQFAETYYNSIIAGDFFPSWSAETNYGFGDIGIRFYPPLAYYVLVLAKICAGNWYEASWMTFIFWMMLGSFGVYLLAKEWLSQRQSAAAAVMYIIAPYHLTQLYQYFLYAEFAAIAILPFCFLFVTRVCRRGKAIDIICLAISYALLLLTHIPTSVIGTLSLGIYAMLLVDWKTFFNSSLKLALAFGLGFSAALFHWLKILTETKWLNIVNPRFSLGAYNYKNNFFPFYINSPETYFTKLLFLKDLTSVFALLLMLPLVIYLFFKLNNSNNLSSKAFRGMAFTGLFAFFMSTFFSGFVWQIFPFLQQLQFPFRWLSVVCVLGAVSFIIGLTNLIQQNIRLKKIVFYFAFLVIFTIAIFDVTQIIIPSAPFTRNDFDNELTDLSSRESFDWSWTIWSKPQAFENKDRVSADLREVKINIWDKQTREFEIEAGKPLNARLATFYYPFWQAEINGKPVELQKSDDGTILVPVQSEKSTVKIFFQEPLL